MVIFKSITILSQSLVKSGLIESKLCYVRGILLEHSFGWDHAAKSSRLHLNKFMSFTTKNGGKKISLRIKKAAAFFKQRSHNFLHQKGRGNIYK